MNALRTDVTATIPGVGPGRFAETAARILSRAAAAATSLAVSTRTRSAGRRARAGDTVRVEDLPRYHSLAESLAIGLGCDSLGRRGSTPRSS